MIKFYDTCALLRLQDKVFEEPFAISSVTIQELDDIKESEKKDDRLRYRAVTIGRWLATNIEQYQLIVYTKDMMPDAIKETPDNQILACAKHLGDVEFITDDTLCYLQAVHTFNINARLLSIENDDYTGFHSISMDDNELADFYSNQSNNKWNLKINEYLIINDGIDVRKWNGFEFVALKDKPLKSLQFGIIKAKDVYQRMAIDSIYANRLTMIKGPAGTGKTLLALGALFAMLDKREIDKIIIFCNPVSTAYSARLGYYKGSKDAKLLDGNLGNILSAKIGDQQGVIRLIEDGKLQILPFSDIRGFDTTNKRAGVLIVEAENLDISLMKLAIQRVSEDSRCIIDGDYEAQVDSKFYAGLNNGMRRASKVFRGELCYGEVELQMIYRSEIARIAERM